MSKPYGIFSKWELLAHCLSYTGDSYCKGTREAPHVRTHGFVLHLSGLRKPIKIMKIHEIHILSLPAVPSGGSSNLGHLGENEIHIGVLLFMELPSRQ